MRRVIFIILALILILFSFNGCAFENLNRVRGSGNMVEVNPENISNIKKIDISRVSAALVIYTEDGDYLNYNIDDNLKELITVEEKDGVLTIASKDGKKVLGYDNKIVFNIGASALEEIVLSGDAVVKAKGIYTADNFKIKIDGAAKIDYLELNNKNTSIEINGAASVNLSGETGELYLKCQGASDVKAKALIAQDAAVEYNGVSSIEIYADKTLKVDGKGVGVLTYWGGAELTSGTQGINTVKKGN